MIPTMCLVRINSDIVIYSDNCALLYLDYLFCCILFLLSVQRCEIAMVHKMCKFHEVAGIYLL